MNLNEIKGRRGALVAEMRAVLDEAKGRELTADEETSYQNMETEFEKLSSDMVLEEKLAKRESEMAALANEANAKAIAPGANPDQPVESSRPIARKEYGEAFLNYVRGAGNREINNAAMQEGTDSEGGYLVPEEWNDSIVTGALDANVIRRYATVIQTASDRNFPIQTVRAAFTWIDEEAAYSDNIPTLGQQTLKAYKLGGVIKVSEELLEDNVFDLPSFLQREAVLEFAKQEEAAFITGNGTGKPEGIEDVTAVGGISTSGVSLAGTAVITSDEVIDIYHDLGVGYRSNATWVTSDGMALLIRKLKDSDNQYLWQPGLFADQPDRLMGRPFEVSDSFTAPATGVRSICFGDLSYYVIADRLGVSVKRLDELYSANGQVGFRFTKRVDGRLTKSDALTYGTQA